MVKFSMLPALLAIQLVVIWIGAQRANRHGAISDKGLRIVFTGLVLIALWAMAIAYLVRSGIFAGEGFLASYPAIWVSLITVLIVELPMAFSRQVKDTVKGLIDATPMHWLIAIHGLRVLAIGSVLKALNGDFSYYFGLLVGIPDLIFGLSAIILVPLVYRNRVSERFIAVWNYIGALIIVPFGIVLMQLGLPGPLQVFTGSPTIATIFEFPMIMAPAVVVPVFVMSNLFVARRILERSRTGTMTAGQTAT